MKNKNSVTVAESVKTMTKKQSHPQVTTVKKPVPYKKNRKTMAEKIISAKAPSTAAKILRPPKTGKVTRSIAMRAVKNTLSIYFTNPISPAPQKTKTNANARSTN